MADRLRLRDWRVSLRLLEGDGDGAGPAVRAEMTPGRKDLQLAVRRQFFRLPAAEQRRQLVRELLLAHFLPARAHVANLRPILGFMFEVWRRGHDDQLTAGVEALASAVAGCLPSIDNDSSA